MVKEIKAVVARAHGLAADTVGAVSLMVMLFAGLHLPTVF